MIQLYLKKLILVGSLSGSSNGALDMEVLPTCPQGHPRYSELLNRLSLLKQQVTKGELCDSLREELSHLEVFYSSDFAQIKELAQQGAESKNVLSVDNLKQVAEFSRGISEKISRVVSSLQRNSDCLNEPDTTSLLSSVAGITQQVGFLAGQYSGPYGVAFSFGASAFAGILQGIDYLLQRYREVYDFRQQKFQELYLRGLCSYQPIRNEIQSLLSPENRIRSLIELSAALREKRSRLAAAHPIAREVSESYLTYASLLEPLSRLKRELAIQKGQNPLQICLALSNLVHEESTSFHQLKTRFEEATSRDGLQYSRRTSLLAEYARLRTSTGSIEQCHQRAVAIGRDRSPEQLLEESNQFSQRALSAWTQSVEDYFLMKIQSLVDSAERLRLNNTETSSALPEYPFYPLRMWQTIERESWVKGEIFRMLEIIVPQMQFDEIINDARQSPSQKIEQLLPKIQDGAQQEKAFLSDQQMYLDRRFFEDLAPRYIKALVDRSQQDEKTAGQEQKKWTESLQLLVAPHVRKIKGGNTTQILSQITQFPSHTFKIEDLRVAYYQASRVLNALEAVAFKTKAARDICNYLGRSGFFHSRSRTLCEDAQRLVASRTKSNTHFFEAVRDFQTYAVQENAVVGEGIDALIARIKNCYSGIPEVPKINKDSRQGSPSLP